MKMHVHVLRNEHWNQEQNENERTVRGLTQTGAGHGTAQHTSLHRGKGRPIAFDRWHGGLLEAKSVPQD
jgi:hypothetical protein